MPFAIEPDDSRPGRFRLLGELDLAGIDALVATLEGADRTEADLVLDLTGLSFIDSSGISAFIRVAREMEGSGRLVLLAPRVEVERILSLVGLENLPNIELHRA